VSHELTHLDLFSGIGGFALAAKWNGFRTLAFCDCEPYAQAVLRKHWPDVHVHGDIRQVRGDLYAGVTLLTGGFPCQPFSVAGKQRGKDDNRYLWPEMCRVIREARPAWIIGENVAGIVNLALDTVCADLEAEGYEVEPIIIPACAVDAPHRRDRVWIIARNVGDTKLDGYVASAAGGRIGAELISRGSSQSQGQKKVEEREFAGTGGSPANVADSDRGQLSQRESEGQSVQVPGEGGERVGDVADSISQRRCGRNPEGEYAEDVGKSLGHSWHNPGGVATWLPEPDVGRVAHGVPNRVAKLRGLGNAIVPQVAAEIIRCIREVIR
jgi:DNA (cytosine-5)-methyltransferase 1